MTDDSRPDLSALDSLPDAPPAPDDRGERTVDEVIVLPDSVTPVALLGPRDELLRTMERQFPRTEILVRGNEFRISGPKKDVDVVDALLGELVEIVRAGQPLNRDAVERSISMLRGASRQRPADVLTQNIVSNRGRTIRPKTLGQKEYVDAIDDHTVIFGIGPAGTGKTYLAMAKAVAALQAKQVTRIILTRPAVEAGERLGFLPGSLNDKIDPYLRPLYDALHDMIDAESIPRLMAAGTIEVAPLAYMRGRAQPVHSQVLTPGGWRSIGELEIGDLVIGSGGMPTPVLGVYPQGEKDVYRVTTQDGASTLCCGEHLWTVRTRSDKRAGRWRTVETHEMVGRERAAHARRYELPVVDPVEMRTEYLALDPYALGLMLGDGCCTTQTTPSFSTAGPELAEALEAGLPGVTVDYEDRYDYVIHRADREGRGGVTVANPMTVLLRQLGIAGTRSSTKFIPPEYLRGRAQDRLALLQGLLDTDGGPVRQAGRTCRVQYTTTSQRLADDTVALVRSLGGVAHRRLRRAAGRRPGLANGRPVGYRHDSHVLDIRLPAGMQPFRLERKREIYETTGGGRPMRFVDSVEPAGRAETVCIQVAAADSLYVTEDYLLTHNTLNDAFIILDEAQNTSPEQMKMFLTRLGFGSKMVVTGDTTQVDLPGGMDSGLKVVQQVLEGIEDIHFAELTSEDVVRHRLVGQIVEAYGRHDARTGGGRRSKGERR